MKNLFDFNYLFHFFSWRNFSFYLLEGIALSAFAAAVARGKRKAAFRIAVAAVFAVLTGFTRWWLSSAGTFNELWLVPASSALLLFFCSLLCGEKPFYRAVTFPLVAINVISVTGTVSENAVVFIRTAADYSAHPNYGPQKPIRIVNLCLLVLLLAVIAIFDRKNEIVLERRERFALVPALILSSASIVLLRKILAFNQQYIFDKIVRITSSRDTIVYSVIILVGTLIITASFYVMLVSISRRSRENTAQAIMAQQYRGQSAMLEEMSKKHAEIARMRHDVTNALGTVDGLIALGKYDDARAYIHANTGSLSADVREINTNNEYVNAIISHKTSKAKKKGVDVTVYSVSTIDFPDNVDLCNLIGNLFDNAITAAAACKGEKTVRLDICRDKDAYRVSVLNTVASPVLTANPDMKTTKRDKTSHGFGMKIIREIAEKYYGSVDCYDTSDGMFCTTVTVFPEKPF